MRIGTIIEPKKIARAFTSGGEHSLANEVRAFMRAGANHIEISGEAIAVLPGPIRNRFAEEASAGLRDLHENDGITFSVHLPFMGGVNFTTSIDSIRDASVGVVNDITRQCAPLEPITYILHIAGLLEDLMSVGLRDQTVIDAYLSYAAESLTGILEVIPHAKLCIENLEYISFERIFPLVERFDTKVCMDVGHIKLRNEDIGEFLRKYGSRLGQIHMHGVTKRLFDRRVNVMDDHQGLGSGIVDADAVIQMAHAIGFDGPVVLEVHAADPLNSVRILKEAIEKSQKSEKGADK